MTRIKALFIHFSLILSCCAKSLKESTIDNENKSHDIKVTSSGIVNDKDSSTVYIKNDDILSISEFSKFYNPEEYHFTNLRFIKDTNSDYGNKVRSKNNKTTLENPKLEEYSDENKTDRNIDATIVDSEEENRESKSEELSTETNEIESTTISIKVQDNADELIEGYDLEVPETIESTEGYFKIDVAIDDTNNDRLDDVMPQIPSRRSLFPTEKLVLDYKGSISNKPVEILEVDQDTVPKSEIISLKEPNEQSKVESTAETPFVAPQPVHPYQVHPYPVHTYPVQPYPVISRQEFPNLSPLLTLKRTNPAGLRQISNQETTNLVKMTPEEYKQNVNLEKSEEIVTKEKTIDDFNSNIYENAYPYTPPKVNSISQPPLPIQPNFNALYSKLTQASGNPFRNRLPSGQSWVNYGAMRPNFNLQNHHLQNAGVYKFLQRPRRFLSCNNCRQNEDKTYMN